MTDRRLGARGRTAIRYAVGALALAWVLSLGDWERLFGLFTRIDTVTLALILLVTAGEFGARVAGLYVLLNVWTNTTAGTAWNIDLGSKFVNHLLPSRVAGQSVFPLLVRQWTDHSWGQAVAITTYNVCVLALFTGSTALVGVVLLGARLPVWLLTVVTFASLLYLIVGAVTLAGSLQFESVGVAIGRFEHRVRGVPVVGDRLSTVVAGVPQVTAGAADPFVTLLRSPRIALAAVSSKAGVNVVAPGLRVWLILAAFGETFTPAVFLPLALVTAYSVTLLPVTPGGIGVAETSGTVVLIALGLSPEAAIGAVLVDRFLGVYIPALLGWRPMLSFEVPTEIGGTDRD